MSTFCFTILVLAGCGSGGEGGPEPSVVTYNSIRGALEQKTRPGAKVTEMECGSEVEELEASSVEFAFHTRWNLKRTGASPWKSPQKPSVFKKTAAHRKSKGRRLPNLPGRRQLAESLAMSVAVSIRSQDDPHYQRHPAHRTCKEVDWVRTRYSCQIASTCSAITLNFLLPSTSRTTSRSLALIA